MKHRICYNNPGTIPRMIRMIRIRKRRLLKKFFLFFTFSTPFSSVMQFDACFLSVRKTVIVYRILIILSQKNGLFYILAKSNLFFAAINAQDISQEILPQSLFYYIRSLLLLRTDMTYSSYTATVLTKFTFHDFSSLFFLKMGTKRTVGGVKCQPLSFVLKLFLPKIIIIFCH